MNSDRVIGVDGDLPWHYSADLKRFKQRTLGTTIIMGRLTWESIGSKPLPGRQNIVISRSRPDTETENPLWCTSIDAAIDCCATEDCWIIGGGQIYQQAMPILNLLDITFVPDQVDHPSAVRFPDIADGEWRLVEELPLEDAPELINRIYFRQS